MALLRLGHADALWPLLKHSADPRLRSFLVNWLSPLGANPKPLVAELDRLNSPPRPAERGEGGRRPGEGSSGRPPPRRWTRSSSTPRPPRRALILALGTYRPAACRRKNAPADRQAARPLRERSRRRHPRRGRVGPAAVGAAAEAPADRCRVERPGPGRSPLVRQQAGTDLRHR